MAALTALVYVPVLDYGFLSFDDSHNLRSNLAYRGLGWPQLQWMFTTTRLGHYIPVTWLSFGLDYVLWGMDPFGYHLTNLVLHVLGAVLCFELARRLLAHVGPLSPGALTGGAAATAFLFAVHPLRVESVAWLTERRDVLSGVLFFTTLLLYVRASEVPAPRARRLRLAAVATYALALGAKASVMTLPAVLLLLDVYPLRRLPPEVRTWTRPAAVAVLREKVPFLAVGGVGAVVAYLAQAREVPLLGGGSIASRAVHIAYSLWFYLIKTVVPIWLSPIYEAPAQIELADPRFAVAVVGTLVVTALVLALRHRWPGALAAWIYYGVMLAPVSGVVRNGPQLTADRFSYLPCLGFALLVGGGLAVALDAAWRGRSRPARPWLASAAVAAAILVLGILARGQTEIWRDSPSLWGHAARLDPGCLRCAQRLGIALLAEGRLAAGLEDVQRALRLSPGAHDLRMVAAHVLFQLARWEEAATQYRQVLAHRPAQRDAQAFLAITMIRLGRPGEAIESLRDVIGRSPDLSFARRELIQAYRALGRLDDARAEYRTLLALDAAAAAGLAPVDGARDDRRTAERMR
ncbi:MAG TPA: tetratricopeptide repeat protein [Methylomirabilota bacterium]|nr:tetratricopeptide repeat protein [Methylomirabilota bacterium]